MKSIKDLREEYNLIVESDSKSSKKMTVATVPTLVVLKRRAIRVFPGGRQVGLYYAQQIDKYVTIPFGDENDRENKRVVNVFEELKQIDELDDRTSMNAFAKLHHKASNAQSKDELVKYVKKTANVGVMHLAKYARKKGWETAGDEAKKLLAYSKKYRKVADLVENNLNEVSSKPVLITPKPKPESSAPSAAPAPNNTSAAPAQAAAPSRKIRGLKYEQLPSKSIPGSAKKKKPNVDIEELDDINYENKRIDISIDFPEFIETVTFTIDCDVNVEKSTLDNIRYYRLNVNGTPIFPEKGFILKENDEVKLRIFKFDISQPSKLMFHGYDPNIRLKKNYTPELVSDEKSNYEEIIVD